MPIAGNEKVDLTFFVLADLQDTGRHMPCAGKYDSRNEHDTSSIRRTLKVTRLCLGADVSSSLPLILYASLCAPGSGSLLPFL